MNVEVSKTALEHLRIIKNSNGPVTAQALLDKLYGELGVPADELPGTNEYSQSLGSIGGDEWVTEFAMSTAASAKSTWF